MSDGHGHYSYTCSGFESASQFSFNILPQWFIVGVCKSPAYEANAVIDSLTFHVHAYNQLNFLWIILLYWKLEEVLGMGPWAQCFRPKNFLL